MYCDELMHITLYMIPSDRLCYVQQLVFVCGVIVYRLDDVLELHGMHGKTNGFLECIGIVKNTIELVAIGTNSRANNSRTQLSMMTTHNKCGPHRQPKPACIKSKNKRMLIA